MSQYDAIIIGGGPGGYVSAIRMAQYGLRVALVERAQLGGACLNAGCIPTKTVLHTAKLLQEAKTAQKFGLAFSDVSIDFDALKARKNEVTQQLRTGIEELLRANHVDVYCGNALVASPFEIHVTGEEGRIDLKTANTVIATGSHPALPAVFNADLPHVYTSDTILAQLPSPNRLTIIGGGVIGVEFASIYHAFGTEVTVLEAADRILPSMDREISQNLSMILKKRGVKIVTGAMTKSVQNSESGLKCIYAAKEKDFEVLSDGILVSVGRIPNTDGLFSAALSVADQKGKIAVDLNMQTHIPHLYAIGDVVAEGVSLAHAASAQGLIAAAHIAKKSCEIDVKLIPSCVYTDPEIASVGITEAEAKKRGMNVRTGKFLMSANGKSLLSGQERSFIKILADESDRVIGAQMMCGRAADLAGELTLAIANGMRIEQIAEIIRPHPTFEEGIGEAADALLLGSIHSAPLKKHPK